MRQFFAADRSAVQRGGDWQSTGRKEGLVPARSPRGTRAPDGGLSSDTIRIAAAESTQRRLRGTRMPRTDREGHEMEREKPAEFKHISRRRRRA